MTLEEENSALKTRVAELESVLGLRKSTLKTKFKLTPVSSALLGLLVELPVVTEEVIQHRAKIAGDAKVAIYRLRQQLKDTTIMIHMRRGTGWWLDEETRESLREDFAPDAFRKEAA